MSEVKEYTLDDVIKEMKKHNIQSKIPFPYNRKGIFISWLSNGNRLRVLIPING